MMHMLIGGYEILWTEVCSNLLVLGGWFEREAYALAMHDFECC